MPAGEEKPLQILIYGAIISILAALVTALIKEGTLSKKTRTLLAGVCCGILLSWILRNAKVDQFYKDIIISLGAAFVTSIWQICEIGITTLLKKYFNKKGNDITDS